MGGKKGDSCKSRTDKIKYLHWGFPLVFQSLQVFMKPVLQTGHGQVTGLVGWRHLHNLRATWITLGAPGQKRCSELKVCWALLWLISISSPCWKLKFSAGVVHTNKRAHQLEEAPAETRKQLAAAVIFHKCFSLWCAGNVMCSSSKSYLIAANSSAIRGSVCTFAYHSPTSRHLHWFPIYFIPSSKLPALKSSTDCFQPSSQISCPG